MLKKLEQHDASALYVHLSNPNLRYIRYRSDSLDEYCCIIQTLLEKEQQGEAIIRVILNEEGHPIGQIALFDIAENTGFLSTWIAESYQGKGFNQRAKDAFLTELFEEKAIKTAYAKIRRNNIRSLKATAKLPYMVNVNEARPTLYQQVNQGDAIYDLFEITMSSYKTYNMNKKGSK